MSTLLGSVAMMLTPRAGAGPSGHRYEGVILEEGEFVGGWEPEEVISGVDLVNGATVWGSSIADDKLADVGYAYKHLLADGLRESRNIRLEKRIFRW